MSNLFTLQIWLIFSVSVSVLLFLDLIVFSRHSRIISFRQALYFTIGWTVLEIAVGIWILYYAGTQLGTEYFVAFVAERALSVDNLFVFLIIFTYFALPQKYYPKALLYGIVGALIARGAFIAIGVTIINIGWVLIILGAFLVFTAVRVWRQNEEDIDPSRNLFIRGFKKIMPVSDKYDRSKFFTRRNGMRMATPFLLVIIALATTDILFAVDSIPTVFAITQEPFIVWSSNVMAVLGMRPLFFLLSGLVKGFRFLQHGLALILAFVGLKIVTEQILGYVLEDDFHFVSATWDALISLGVIILILAGSILLSVLRPEDKPEEPPTPPEPAIAE